MTIYLIRHGQKNRTLTNILPSKVGLTELGKKQAEAFAEYARSLNIGKIYVSPYLRTKETAAPIEKALNIKAKESEVIAEVGVGEYLRLVRDKILNEKVLKFEESFKEDLISFAEKGNNILIVTHSGYLRMLKAILTKTGGSITKKLSLLFSPMHNLGMTKVVIKGGELKIEEFDNTDFLPEELKNKFPY